MAHGEESLKMLRCGLKWFAGMLRVGCFAVGCYRSLNCFNRILFYVFAIVEVSGFGLVCDGLLEMLEDY